MSAGFCNGSSLQCSCRLKWQCADGISRLEAGQAATVTALQGCWEAVPPQPPPASQPACGLAVSAAVRHLGCPARQLAGAMGASGAVAAAALHKGAPRQLHRALLWVAPATSSLPAGPHHRTSRTAEQLGNGKERRMGAGSTASWEWQTVPVVTSHTAQHRGMHGKGGFRGRRQEDIGGRPSCSRIPYCSNTLHCSADGNRQQQALEGRPNASGIRQARPGSSCRQRGVQGHKVGARTQSAAPVPR